MRLAAVIASATGAFQAAGVQGGIPALWAAVPAGTAEVVHGPAVRGVHRVPGDLAVAVAAADGGNRPMIKERRVESRAGHLVDRGTLRISLLIATICILTAISPTARAAKQSASATSLPAQKAFATPNEAARALIQAAQTFDLPALKQILGPDGDAVAESGDPVRDKNIATAFAAKAHEKNEVVLDPKNPKRAILNVGNDNWPLPIPILQRAGKWYFDTKAGRQEMLYRRIGANELDAIQVCRGYVEAQEQYALQPHDGVNQYAQQIISTRGKQDGLAWQNPDGSWGGPVGETIAKAIAQGYSARGQAFHGYYFKILRGQGPSAPLGKMSFVVEGAMIGGFALAAAPAQYRVTGVKTFIVSYEGIVYQKDLGPDTLKIFESMEFYNPDKTWQPTDDNW
jgi:hypothetical protein